MGRLAFLLVQDVFYHSLAVVGVAANLMTIVILCRGNCRLTGCTVRYLVAMAGSDLLVIIFCVILDYLGSLYFCCTVLIYSQICSINSIMKAAAVDSSVWLTVAFTFDRFVAICCPRLKPKYCTDRAAMAAIITVSVVSYLRNIPRYFTSEPVRGIAPFPICRIRNLCAKTPWAAYMWSGTVLTPLIPYVGILLLNGLTVRHILIASRARRGFHATRANGRQVDPEMENRRRSIILLFAISGSFVILWMTKIVAFVYQEILLDVSSMMDVAHVGSMLMYLNSCSNTCIYALTQAKFREQVKLTFSHPVLRLLKVLSNRTADSTLERSPRC